MPAMGRATGERCGETSECTRGVCAQIANAEFPVCVDPCVDEMCPAGYSCIWDACLPMDSMD